MKAKLLAIASSALFLIASSLAASATTFTYTVSGGWLLPPDTFSGGFDPLVGAGNANITVEEILKGPTDVTLPVFTDVTSYNYLGKIFGQPVYSVTVTDGTGSGSYSLTFDLTLPTTGHNALVSFVSLFEDVCRDRCNEKSVALFGGGIASLDPAPTPLPAALPLLAGGLGVIGLIAGRRKRKSAILATA